MRTGIAIFFFDKVSFLKHPTVHCRVIVAMKAMKAPTHLQRFLASQDALEVMRVTHSLTESLTELAFSLTLLM